MIQAQARIIVTFVPPLPEPGTPSARLAGAHKKEEVAFPAGSPFVACEVAEEASCLHQVPIMFKLVAHDRAIKHVLHRGQEARTTTCIFRGLGIHACSVLLMFASGTQVVL